VGVLGKEQQHERLRAADVEPAERVTTLNIAVDGFLGRIAVGLEPTETKNISASHLALGVDDTEPEPENDALKGQRSGG
jgi:hypothetical protein